MKRIYLFFFTLLAIILPIEHKYDKPLRYFSKGLIPEGLILPKWFDPKLYFYPTDLAAPILLLLTLFTFKTPLRRLLFDRTTNFLWAMLLLSILSVTLSPYWNYPLFYLRLWQWGTAICFFCLAKQFREHLHFLCGALISMGLLQSLFAIAQYFNQGSFGLRLLGEPNFHPNMPGVTGFWVPGGSRWIFDSPTTLDPSVVLRVMGTTSHPNILGGFLALTSLASLDCFVRSDKKWGWGTLIFLQLFGLTVTFSRSAIFAFFLGTFLWFLLNRKKALNTSLILASSVAILSLLFHEQIASRGGIVNYNSFVQGADEFRTTKQHLAFQMIEKHPLTGIGFQQFSLRAHEILHNDPNQHVNGVHNIYLLMAAEMGLPALLCFLALIASIFWNIRNSSIPPSLLCMAAALLFIGLFDFYLTQFQMGRLLLFLTLGLAASFGDKQRELSLSLEP